MKTSPDSFARNYRAALHRHLQPGAQVSLDAARALGVHAVKLKLDTLDLARIHEEALQTLKSRGRSTDSRTGGTRRAGAFFSEALTPIEETHRVAREAHIHLKVLLETLTRRTEELAVRNLALQSEIARRQTVEDTLRTSEKTTSRLLEKARRMQEELRFLSRRLLSVQEEERKRISRELHDVVAQTLTVINLRLSSLKEQTIASGRELHRKIAFTQRLVEKSVAIVHRFARDLRPAVLDDLGLIPALQSYVKGYQKETGLRVEFAAFPGVEKQDSTVRTVLYRVVQEALTNVARHAKAREVRVSIRNLRGSVVTVIRDDGQGFQVDEVMVDKKSKGLGLLGMRERVEMVGGTFSVESAPGKPTTLRAVIPPRRGSTKKPSLKRS